MSLIILEEQKRPLDSPGSFDYIGSVSIFIWIAGLLILLSFATRWELLSAPNISIMSITILFFVIFLIAEKRASDPVINLGLFRSRVFTIATLAIH